MIDMTITLRYRLNHINTHPIWVFFTQSALIRYDRCFVISSNIEILMASRSGLEFMAIHRSSMLATASSDLPPPPKKAIANTHVNFAHIDHSIMSRSSPLSCARRVRAKSTG